MPCCILAALLFGGVLRAVRALQGRPAPAPPKVPTAA